MVILYILHIIALLLIWRYMDTPYGHSIPRRPTSHPGQTTDFSGTNELLLIHINDPSLNDSRAPSDAPDHRLLVLSLW